MKRRRVASGVAGVLSLACALALGGDPAGGAVQAMASALGNDYFVMAAFAGVGLLVAAAAAVSGRSDALQQTETPTPERPVTAPVAGDAVDETLASRTALLPVVGGDRREELRERLRTVAVETWVRRGEYTREEARQRLDAATGADGHGADERAWTDGGKRTGTTDSENTWDDGASRTDGAAWTDDEEAVAFLAGREPGVEARLSALLRAEPWSRRGARRAVRAIAELESEPASGRQRDSAAESADESVASQNSQKSEPAANQEAEP